MLADTIQKSVLEWLQLTPELLSGLSGRPVARAEPLATPPPAPQQAASHSRDVAPINLHSVLPGSTGMSFHQPAAAGRGYASMEDGGSQRAALTEMTGYLTTRLVPSP